MSSVIQYVGTYTCVCVCERPVAQNELCQMLLASLLYL